MQRGDHVFIESQSVTGVVDVARIMHCNILQPMETAVLMFCDTLRHSASRVAEIGTFYLCDTLRHPATQWKPGLTFHPYLYRALPCLNDIGISSLT